jgi:serine/threonine protein kinase
MAPEQVRGKALPASDLYSLGVTCVHLLTGVSPFDLFDINHDRWAWRDYLLTETKVSDRLGQVLDKLLQSAISQRYQSATAVLQALNPVKSSQIQAVRSQRSPKAFPQADSHSKANSLITQGQVDYTRLRNALASARWEEADQVTWALLCEILGKPPKTYLNGGDIENFPCLDLRTIDQLWTKYSHKHFGFSVQTKIYESVAQDYGSFCDRVGWPSHNSISVYTVMNFSRLAPRGHLPSRIWVGGYYWWRHPSFMASRLTACQSTCLSY